MECIYNTKTMELNNGKRLSPVENKILISLSDENIINNKDISMYVYGYYNNRKNDCIKSQIYNLRKKGLNIINKIGYGYRLISRIKYF